MINMSFNKYSILKIMSKLIFSMVISFIMVALMVIIPNNKFLLFLILTIMNYFSVEAILHIFTIGTTSYYDKVISELYQIQSNYINRVELSDEKKQLLKYKFIHVKGYFLKSVLTLQFLRTDNYNPELEIESLKTIAQKTIELYVSDMKQANISEELINCFNKIHESETTKFLNIIIKTITHESLILERRHIFKSELVKLMTLSVKHFLEALIESGCEK